MKTQLQEDAEIVCLALDARAVEFHAINQALTKARRQLAGLKGAPAWLAACSLHGGPDAAIAALKQELRDTGSLLADAASEKFQVGERIKRLQPYFPVKSIESLVANLGDEAEREELATQIMANILGVRKDTAIDAEEGTANDAEG